MPKTIEERIQTLEDYKEIIELKARYCNAVDGGWTKRSNDGDAVCALFVQDGVWAVAPDGPRAEGHAAIRAAVEQFGSIPFIIHNVMNPVIRVDGNWATGQWHAIFCMNEPSKSSAYSLSFGIYDEEYVRTEGGWKFKLLSVTSAGTVSLRSPI